MFLQDHYSEGWEEGVWVRKCSLFACLSSQLFSVLIVLRGSGSDLAHKHSSPSQRTLLWRPPETRHCRCSFVSHLDALTAILCATDRIGNMVTVNILKTLSILGEQCVHCGWMVSQEVMFIWSCPDQDEFCLYTNIWSTVKGKLFFDPVIDPFLPTRLCNQPCACMCVNVHMCELLHGGLFPHGEKSEGHNWWRNCVCFPTPSQTEWWWRSLLSGQQVEHLPEGQAHLLSAWKRRHGNALRRATWVQIHKYISISKLRSCCGAFHCFHSMVCMMGRNGSFHCGLFFSIDKYFSPEK